ncbi:MAG: PorV/PorQ family protein [Ignavibacteriaceae bacterium]
MKYINLKLLIILFVIVAKGSLFSQSKTGTTIGQFLKIEPCSRIAGIGNAGVSLGDEASAVFYNPAALGRLKGYDVQFTYNQWLADISYNYAVAALNFEGLGTFALQVISLNSGEIDVRTVDQPLGTGEKYNVTNFSLGLGYSIMLTDRVSVGLLANYITETIWHSSMSVVGFNFGVQYSFLQGDANLGASVSNFGTKGQYSGRDLYIDYDFDPNAYGNNDLLPAEFRTDSYSLPTTFRAGISYLLHLNNDIKILAAADAMHPNDNDESINLGTEVSYLENLYLRGGFRNLFLDDSEGGLMLGAGVKIPLYGMYKVRFDYAWADYGRLLKTHRFTLGISFGM